MTKSFYPDMPEAFVDLASIACPIKDMADVTKSLRVPDACL